MLNFTGILSDLQAAIAVVAARERHLTGLLVAVWARIARMRTRLERLVALWRAGMLPAPRKSRAGETRTRVRTKSEIPTAPAWLLEAVFEARAFGSQLEHLLSGEEAAAFLAAVPRAGRILRPLCRMLGVGVAARTTRRPRPVWDVPAPVMVPAGLVIGPGGRLTYV